MDHFIFPRDVGKIEDANCNTLLIEKMKGGDKMVKDSVCGMEIDEKKAAAKSEYREGNYYFCCPVCKESFEKEPEKYVKEE